MSEFTIDYVVIPTIACVAAYSLGLTVFLVVFGVNVKR